MSNNQGYYDQGPPPHQNQGGYPPQGSPYPPNQSPYGQPHQSYPGEEPRYPQHQGQQGQYPTQQQPPYGGYGGPGGPGAPGGPPQYGDAEKYPPGQGPPGSDVEFGEGAEGERGLGTIALGAATGGFVGHKAGHHGMLGALGGALTAGVVDHMRKKSKERRNDRYEEDDGLAYGDGGRHSRPSSGYGGGSSYAGSSAALSGLHPEDARHGRHHHHHHHHGSHSSHSRSRSRGGDDYEDDRRSRREDY